MFSNKKKHEEKEKTHRMAQRCESRRLGHYRVAAGGTGVAGGGCGGCGTCGTVLAVLRWSSNSSLSLLLVVVC